MKLNKYISYTNSTHTKPSAVALAMAHEEADKYAKGSYDTCAVGCMTGGKNHHLMGELFGFDPRTGHVMDKIFEGLPNGGHKTFIAKVFKAMPEGVDTTKVYAQFMAKVLRRAAKRDKSGSCEAVAKLHDFLVDGEYAQNDWDAAKDAAMDAAGDAADAAGDAAWGAARDDAWGAVDAARDAANAEYQLQAKDLIESCEYFWVKND